MEFLSNTWLLWLVLSAASIGATYLYRKSGRREATGFFITAEDFTVRKIMFDFRKGEGDLFLGFLASMVFFSMFLLGLVQFVRGFF
jgi:hypothetical protein